jgi:hypothetical protein
MIRGSATARSWAARPRSSPPRQCPRNQQDGRGDRLRRCPRAALGWKNLEDKGVVFGHAETRTLLTLRKNPLASTFSCLLVPCLTTEY